MTFRELPETPPALVANESESPELSPHDRAEARSPEALVVTEDAVIRLRAMPTRVQIGREITTVLAFNGCVPGPTLLALAGNRAVAEIQNDSGGSFGLHWRGLRFDAQQRGAAWGRIEPGAAFRYELSFPDPGAYWYRPHNPTIGPSGIGLCGAVVVRPRDSGYWSPVDRELVVMCDDVRLDPIVTGSVVRTAPSRAARARVESVLLVNGEANGRFEVRRGEVVRLYAINAAIARSFNLRIPGARIKTVGSDNGRVERERFVDEALLAPAERLVLDVFFPRAGLLQLEHRTPGRSYRLADVAVASSESGAAHLVHFETLRYNAEFAAERTLLERIAAAPPDVTLHLADDSDAQADDPGPSTFWQGDRIKLRVANVRDVDRPLHRSLHVQGQRFLVITRDGVASDVLAWKDAISLRAGEVADLLVEMSSPGTWRMHITSPHPPRERAMPKFHVQAGRALEGRHP